MNHLRVYNKQDILSQTNIRRFETKLGERIQLIRNPNHLEQSIQESTADLYWWVYQKILV